MFGRIRITSASPERCGASRPVPMPILNQEHLDPLIIAEAVFADPPLMNQVAFKSMSHAAIPP